MTKAQFVAEVAEKLDFTKKDAETIVDLVFTTVKNEVLATGEFTLPLLGKLKVKEAAARSGTTNGKPWSKPAHKVLRFKAAKQIKEDLAK